MLTRAAQNRNSEPRPEGSLHGPRRAAKADEDAKWRLRRINNLDRVFDRAFHGPRRAAKGDEDTLPVWGQGFGAAELPLGAELYVSAGSAGDLVAGNPANRVFDRAFVKGLFRDKPLRF